MLLALVLFSFGLRANPSDEIFVRMDDPIDLGQLEGKRVRFSPSRRFDNCLNLTSAMVERIVAEQANFTEVQSDYDVSVGIALGCNGGHSMIFYPAGVRIAATMYISMCHLRPVRKGCGLLHIEYRKTTIDGEDAVRKAFDLVRDNKPIKTRLLVNSAA